ncbi:hypothetical protein B0T22DRAFT_435498 [Podospora appendiculata]|uniref:Extracellular membrane protein CFEM domain-containing protein n=1 Tax=Podospora appendiculata TaxID=314037 RepID=A0AAE0XF65_9PEZI|nr:hypothetical protein B0T22DRAFT_435498 [Podospora appendiculata]
MARHVTSWSPRWAGLFCLASTASALSLKNFQLITSPDVSIGCILAYNTQIPVCSPKDFTRGNSCSTGCVNSLGALQTTLQSVCGSAEVSASSLLGQALLGNLQSLLCPSASPTPSSSSSSTSSKTTLTTIVVPSTTSTTSTTSTQSSTTTTPSQTQEFIPSSSPASPSETPAQTSVNQAPPQSTAPASTAASDPTQTTGAQQSDTAADPRAGRGDPFDLFNPGPSSGASRLPVDCWGYCICGSARKKHFNVQGYLHWWLLLRILHPSLTARWHMGGLSSTMSHKY